MRKFKFQKGQKNKINTNGISVYTDDISELKALMDLRKTSSMFKEAFKKKIDDVIKKLSGKMVEEWSEEDEELNNYIKEYCLPLIR